MNARSLGLRWRIAAWCALILLTVQIGGLALFAQIGRTSALANVRAELATGERVFARLIDQRVAQLTQAARVLAADFGFREAVMTRDRDTVESALNNHGARIDANLMLLLNLDGIVMADVPGAGPDMIAGLPALVDMARDTGSSTALAVVHGGLHQLVVLPVLAPVPVAWVAVGFAVDAAFALDLESVLGLEVSFVQQNGKENWSMAGSSFSGELQEALAPEIRRIARGADIIELNGVEYVSTLTAIESDPGQGVAVILQIPLERALAPWRELYQRWFWLSVGGMALMLVASAWMGRTIASPVSRLAEFARRVERGEYAHPPSVERDDEIGQLADAFGHMIDAIAAREKRITELAYRDALTGLPNRVMFREQAQSALSAAVRDGAPFAVLTLDIDRFKMVNDALGHRFGDQLLRDVAKRLVADHPGAARLGGDEFAIHLRSDAGDASETALLIGRALDEPMSIQGQLVDVRASIGIAVHPEHGRTVSDLMRHADIAMHLAKRHNAGIEIYNPAHDQQNVARLSLLTELRQAVECNELVLYYQPKASLRPEAGTHMEALVRWVHPQRGFIPPMDFIPFAEQTGYIRTITLWVMETAISRCARWTREGRNVHVGLNLSARDLASADLPGRFAEMLEVHGCDPELITLEITESALLDDPMHALDNLQRLRSTGCRLSIDDYGTGYSSLSYLRQMPVQEMKVDRSFVKNLIDHETDEIIVRSTIELAHNMGLSVTAEGVEDEATLERLWELGCDFAQGYLISRPIPEAELESWLSESQWAGRSHACTRSG